MSCRVIFSVNAKRVSLFILFYEALAQDFLAVARFFAALQVFRRPTMASASSPTSSDSWAKISESPLSRSSSGSDLSGESFSKWRLEGVDPDEERVAGWEIRQKHF